MVEPLAPESVSKGGILIPDTAKERPMQAKVIAVGKGRPVRCEHPHHTAVIMPLEVKAGDTVLIGKFSGQHVKIEENDYVIVREDEILAITN